MVKFHITWNFTTSYNPETYGTWAQKAIEGTLKPPGLIEFRAQRSLVGSMDVLIVTIWELAVDWGAFAENTCPVLQAEGRANIMNVQTTLWGTSPVVSHQESPIGFEHCIMTAGV